MENKKGVKTEEKLRKVKQRKKAKDKERIIYQVQ